MDPSEKYAVDSTLQFGTTTVNLTKSLSALYTAVNSELDNTISINKLNDNIVKKVYRKSDKYNSLYDDSITFSSSPSGSSDVVKYYKRTGFPVDNVNITNAIIYGANNENRVYSIGYNGDASSIYNANSAGNLKFIRDLEYNKILFAITAKEYSSIPVLEKGTIDYETGTHVIPTVSNIDLKDIDKDKYYLGYESQQAKIWNGSGWSNIDAHPILVACGDTVQSIQSAGTAFYSEIPQYGMITGSGTNLSISVGSYNWQNYGYNFCNEMDRSKYTLGWADSYSSMPNWADIHEDIFTEINQHMIDNSQSNMSCTISREIISVSDNMSMLVSVVGQFSRNSSRIYYASINCMMYPLLKGSALLKLLAGFGCYYRADSSLDVSTLTPETLSESNYIWLGAMSADGTTSGTWIKGSDIDSYEGYNKDGNTNNPNFDPSGGGGGGGGYEDDPWSGVSFSGVGVGGAGAFAKCYYMTSTELANLRSWMNSNNVPEGFDPMAQIIGLSQVPVSLSGDDNTTVQFVNSSAVYDPGVTRVVDSGVSTQIAMGTPKRYSLGSINIKRRMQERGEPYLDYDCQIELYLPLIGMFSLDTQAVMGRTITAEAVLDPISGTLAAYAYVSRDGQNLPIAYGSTTIGVDLPITAQQYSVARAALKQANAQLGTSLLSSTLSLIAATTAGGKGSGTGAKTATGSNNGLAAAGIREAGADYMKASQAGNVFGDFMQWGRTIRQLSYGNNTAVAGSFGGSSAQWSYPFTPYVKIIRPRYEKPSNYNHSQGVPCVQAKTVGSCTGFIQCIGVDVSGITRATDIERQAIQAALANGVFAGGGS